MAGCRALARSRSGKRPSACGRMTSRSHAVVYQRSSPLATKTLKWLAQKSTITSWSCRSLRTARSIRAAGGEVLGVGAGILVVELGDGQRRRAQGRERALGGRVVDTRGVELALQP